MEPGLSSSSTIFLFIILIVFVTAIIGFYLTKEPSIKKQATAFLPLVCIRKYPQIDEAQIAKNYLVSNGIKADIFNEGAGSAQPSLNFIEGGRLMVKEEDKEQALTLLREFEPVA